MSGPWEQFATMEEEGPWSMFGVEPKPTFLQQAVEGWKRGQQLIAPIARIPGDVATKAAELGGKAVLGAVNLPNTLGVPGAPRVTPETFMPTEGATGVLQDVNKLAQQTISGLRGEGFAQFLPGAKPPTVTPIQQPIAHAIGRAAHETITPENVALAGVLAPAELPAAANKALGVAFGLPIVKEGIQKLQAGDTEGAVINLLLGGAMTGSAAIPERQAGPMLQPEDVQTKPTPVDLARIQGMPVMGGTTPFIPQEKVRTGTAEVPIVGERPMTVEQPVVGPWEKYQSEGVIPPSGVAPAPKEVPLAGQVSFEGQGIPSARQAGAMVPDNVIKSENQLSGTKMFSGAKVDPEDLRPAILLGRKLLLGQRGDTHADILERNGIDPESIPHESPARGFAPEGATSQYAFMDRKQAMEATGLKGTAEAGGLDSMDLPDAAEHKLLREPEQKTAKEPLDEVDTAANTMRRKVEFYDTLARQLKASDKPKDVERGNELQKIHDELVGNEGGRLYSGLPVDIPRDARREAVKRALLYQPAIRDAKGEIHTGEGHYEIRAGGVKGEAGYLTEDKQFLNLTQIARLEEQRLKEGKGVLRDVREESGVSKLYSGVPLPGLDPAEVKKSFDRLKVNLSNREDAARLLDAADNKSNRAGWMVRRRIEHAPEVEQRKLADNAIVDMQAELFARRIDNTFLDKRIEEQFPYKTSDPAKAAQAYVSAAHQIIYRKEWIDRLKGFKTASGEAFIRDMVKKKGGGWTTPDGYVRKEVTPGVAMAVHKDYAGLMNDLLDPSKLREWYLTKKALEIESGLKHTMLMFDSYHMFRVMERQASITHRTGDWNKGLSVLELDKPEVARMVKAGELTKEMGAWVESKRADMGLLMDEGLNVGKMTENLDNNFWRKELKVNGFDINLFGRFNKFVFDKLTRGAMTMSALHEIDRVAKERPELTRRQAAAYAAKQMNVMFGNLGKQGVLKSASLRDAAQLIALAPGWVESMAQTEARAYKQVADVSIDLARGKGLRVGSAARSVTTWAAAAFVVNQVINMATRGKPTWENEEPNRKLDAWVPGGPNGFWISPFSTSAEFTHDYLRYGMKGYSPVESTVKIAKNKLSPLARGVETFAEGRDFSGRRLDTEERLKATGKAVIPTPLFIAGATSDVPGQEARQLYGSLGFKAEPAGKHEAIGSKTMKERIEQVRQEKANKPRSYDDKARMMEEVGFQQQERAKRVLKSLSRQDQNWLESRSLTIPGIDSTIRHGRDRVPMSEEEVKRYQDGVKTIVQDTITRYRDDESFNAKPTERQQEQFNAKIRVHTERLRHEIMRDMGSNAQKMGNTDGPWKKYKILQPE